MAELALDTAGGLTPMGGPVLFGIPEWGLGGPPVFMERLARGLLKDGRDARVLLTESDTRRVNFPTTLRERPADIAFDVLPCGSDDSWGERWEALIRYLEERAPCTYVMVHDWRNNGVAARLSDRVRLIGVVQADIELELDQAVRLGRYWDAIVAKSDVIHFGVAQRDPQLYPRLVTILNAAPNPPAALASRTSSPTLRIAYCGALRPGQKRVHDLIAIARGLHARSADFELTIMGDGSERDRLERAAAPLTDLGLVRFTGLVPNAELLEALGAHDSFVLTSEFEGLSNALLEAMSRGCVPVITDIATHADLVRDGVSGYRVPSGDVDAFVDRLSRLADDPPVRRRMSTAAVSAVAQQGYRPADMIAAWVQLLDDVERRAASRQFVRPRDAMARPPRRVDGIDVLTGDQDHDVAHVNVQPAWPDRHVPASARRRRRRRPREAWDDVALEDHRVLVTAPFGQISGVDTFSTHLVRGLRRRGIDAAILGAPRLDGSLGLEFAEDLPVEAPGFAAGMSWPQRWRTMTEHLAGQGPCIYLPNYDYDCSGVSAALPARVKVLPIAHSDDPAHYDHVLRIGAVSNAIVGVSDVIVDHIARLAPTWIERLHTIRYGVDLAPSVGETGDRAPLRVVYVGRLIEHQKRISDVLRIARQLAVRGVDFELMIIGDGPDRAELEQASRELRLDRQTRFLGPLANDQVLRVLGQSDAFLLVSAFEGLSVGMLEAMAHQVVPVVSATRSGTPEVIRHGENGLIAAVGDVDGFAQALTRLARDPQLRRRLAVAARRTIVEQSLQTDDMVARYVAVLEGVAARPFYRPRGAVIVPAHLRGQTSVRRRARSRAGRSVRRAASLGRRAFR